MSNWDFRHKSVQEHDKPEHGAQVGSKSVLISFGPPDYKANADANFVVCGFIQNMTLNQQKQVQQVFEIGSERSYYADGPMRNMLNISRALFSGPSILKVMGSGLLGQDINKEYLEGDDEDPGGLFEDKGLNAAGVKYDKNFWINLGSDLFQNPLGILLQIKEFRGDGEDEVYGEAFLQNCKLTSHSLQMQAGQWLMQESIQIQFERVVPVSDTVDVNKHYGDRTTFINKIHNQDIAEISENSVKESFEA